MSSLTPRARRGGRSGAAPPYDATTWRAGSPRPERPPSQVGNGSFSPLAILLAVALVGAPALALISAGWVDGLSLVGWLAAAGLTVGLIVAWWDPPRLIAHVGGLLVGEALAVAVVAATLPAPTPASQVTQLAQRFANWLRVVVLGGTANDNVLFLLALACVAWFVGYTCAYSICHDGSPWWSILLTGSALLVNLAYLGRPTIHLSVYLVCALLLVVHLNVAAQERLWRRGGLVYPRRGAAGILAVGVGLSLLLYIGAFVLPSHDATQALIERARTLGDTRGGPLAELRAELGRLFAGVPGQSRDAASGFASTMTLKGEFHLGPDVVADVVAPRGRYWRAVAYERYTGRGWDATVDPRTEIYSANDPRPPIYERRETLTQRVTVRAPRSDALLAAGQPVELGVTVSLEHSAIDGVDPVAADLASAMRSPRARIPGLSYSVTSAIPVVDVATLRQAGTSYPPAIVQHFGQVPDVPERVKTLARRLAPASLSPYDRASAIEGYLRRLRYDLKVSEPPTNRDGVDYFLFDSQVGYCDYFATAMVVLLRSAGVPARVVSGYAVGERDGVGDRWVIRDANAHSWVEAYFPRYGWIEFEPSPNRPAPQRAAPGPLPDPPPASPTPGALASPTVVPATAQPTLVAPTATPMPAPPIAPALGSLPLVPIAMGLAALGALALAGRQAWRWGIADLPAAEAGYARMARLAWLTGLGAAPEQTPGEFATALAAAIPEARPAVDRLTAAFVERRWARPEPTSAAEPTSADLEPAWRAVRRSLLRRAVSPRAWPSLRRRAST